MNDLNFISYTPTPEEKHWGIAEVSFGRIVLRYKISPNTKGEGFFASAPSVKIGKTDEGKDLYAPAFLLDSTTENAKVLDFVRKNVKRHIDPKPNEDIPF